MVQLDGLWDVSLQKMRKKLNLQHNEKWESINCIILKNQSKLDIALYYHATIFSPTCSTLQQAAKNQNFVKWPGIEKSTVSLTKKKTVALEKGHLDQERKICNQPKT